MSRGGQERGYTRPAGRREILGRRRRAHEEHGAGRDVQVPERAPVVIQFLDGAGPVRDVGRHVEPRALDGQAPQAYSWG